MTIQNARIFGVIKPPSQATKQQSNGEKEKCTYPVLALVFSKCLEELNDEEENINKLNRKTHDYLITHSSAYLAARYRRTDSPKRLEHTTTETGQVHF